MINSKSNLFARVDRLNFLKTCIGNKVSGIKILDLGGNHGNLLKDGLATGEIVESNYTCLDVDELVLDKSRKEYPDANWVFYNRFNQHYNPTGEVRIPFPFEDNSFDVVFCYSIHTHTSYEDFAFDLKEMQRVAKVVCTSIFNPTFGSLVTKKRVYDYGDVHPDWYTMETIEKYKYFIDADKVCTEEKDIDIENDYLITVYNIDWLMNQHPEITRYIPEYVNKGFGRQPFLVIGGEG